MTSAYIDSSCLVAVLLQEAAASRLGFRLRRYEYLFASDLLEAEVCAAARREGVTLSRPAAFRNLVWVFPDRPLSDELDRALGAGYLRGADVWHVASALYLRREIADLDFLTLDRPQADVASALGFRTPLQRR